MSRSFSGTPSFLSLITRPDVKIDSEDNRDERIMNMKLGIIGTGMIVENFLPYLVKMEGLEIKALLSTPRSLDKAREMADRFSIAFVTADFDELCGMNIDTVYVAVPNFMHFDYCR